MPRKRAYARWFLYIFVCAHRESHCHRGGGSSHAGKELQTESHPLPPPLLFEKILLWDKETRNGKTASVTHPRSPQKNFFPSSLRNLSAVLHALSRGLGGWGLEKKPSFLSSPPLLLRHDWAKRGEGKYIRKEREVVIGKSPHVVFENCREKKWSRKEKKIRDWGNTMLLSNRRRMFSPFLHQFP